MAVFACALNDRKEFFRDGLSEWSDLAVSHGDLVDRADRGDLGGGTGKEDLVGDVKHLSRDHLLDDRKSEVLGDLDD